MSLHLCIDVNDFSMADIAGRVESFLADQGCDSALIFEVHLVVEELLVNVVQYSAAKGADLSLDVTGGALVLEVIDSGAPFNPLDYDVQGLSDDFADREIGGMGIHLVKEMMDELSYRFDKDKNILRAVKKLHN
jgi:serine/threonine-protein kinase RsbW